MTEPDQQDLLVELGCEELPPGTLQQLAEAFCSSVRSQLEAAGIEYRAEDSRVFYTPRRLAFRLAGVAGRQPDQVQERKGPSVAAAFDADGQPTQAALGFARSVDRPVDALDRQKTDKGEWLFCRVESPGKPLGELLFPMLEKALAALPIAKPMRWAAHDYSFVRPVHWLLVLHGDTVVPGRLFGLDAGRATRGHRVHAPGPHAVNHASEYEQVLESARVLVDPELRRERIREAAVQAAGKLGGKARITPALLTEVSHIVEWPVAIPCAFDTGFLEVPPEALIASMEDHQKFFPAEDPDSGALTANFVAIANLESSDPAAVRDGLERVIRPRLADARFFWEQDLQQPLEAYAPRLDEVLFQQELGSVRDKSRRLEKVVAEIAELTGIKSGAAARAATLCKCDLLTQMVNEFPELQGTMGGHYARAGGEPDAVARAIAEHYAPRFAGDDIPGTEPGRLLALADRLDTLVGIFAIGRKPTGSKDPFALRRAALGAVRIMLEAPLAVPLDPLFGAAASALESQVAVPAEQLEEARAFLLARARQHCIDQGHPTRLVNAVFAAPVSTLPDLAARLEALNAFMQLDEAEALVAANKRIGNIIQSAEQDTGDIDEDRLDLPEEKALFEEVIRLEATVVPRFDRGEYDVALAALAALDRVIAPFFDAVMVMDDDAALRHNRLSLLSRLKRLFDRVADLSQAA